MGFPRLAGIDRLPEDIVWRLVESVYSQRAAVVVGALCCALLGAAGYVGTGSLWYLAGVIYTAVITAWRLTQMHAFHRSRESATPHVWARRNLLSGGAVAVGWAAWTAIVPFEHEPALVAMVLGIHAGLITGGAVRNNAIREIALLQTVIGSPPLLLACVFSPSPYLHLYAGIVAIHFLAAVALSKFLNEQTMRLLTSEKQARELAAELANANEELALMNEHLEEQVGLDPLTGLPNRRAFDLAAAREWRNAAREGHVLTVMMIDIDYFKLFNDHYGHQAGDDCLRRVSATMSKAFRRPVDLLARFGGEEFIALLQATEPEGAAEIAERMMAALAECAIKHEAAPLGRVSVSVGIAGSSALPGQSLHELVSLADQALYAAKRGGRNRAVVQPPMTLSSLNAA